MSTTPSTFAARLVLLGASNLTRGISTVVETARLTLGTPLEIVAALGHGRSYGMTSRVLGRSLPSILECEIWRALDESRRHGPQAPTFALITDIGNDIMYGANPQAIERWIETCIDRLEACGAAAPPRIAMTMIPIERIRVLQPWQYAVVRAVLFPTRRLTFTQAIESAHELHERLAGLARRRGVRLIELKKDWYGFDPIHIRARHWPASWSEILAAGAECEARRARGSLRRWLRLRSLTPHQWWWLGIERGRAQPACVLADGTTVSLY